MQQRVLPAAGPQCLRASRAAMLGRRRPQLLTPARASRTPQAALVLDAPRQLAAALERPASDAAVGPIVLHLLRAARPTAVMHLLLPVVELAARTGDAELLAAAEAAGDAAAARPPLLRALVPFLGREQAFDEALISTIGSCPSHAGALIARLAARYPRSAGCGGSGSASTSVGGNCSDGGGQANGGGGSSSSSSKGWMPLPPRGVQAALGRATRLGASWTPLPGGACDARLLLAHLKTTVSTVLGASQSAWPEQHAALNALWVVAAALGLQAALHEYLQALLANNAPTARRSGLPCVLCSPSTRTWLSAMGFAAPAGGGADGNDAPAPRDASGSTGGAGTACDDGAVRAAIASAVSPGSRAAFSSLAASLAAEGRTALLARLEEAWAAAHTEQQPGPGGQLYGPPPPPRAGWPYPTSQQLAAALGAAARADQPAAAAHLLSHALPFPHAERAAVVASALCAAIGARALNAAEAIAVSPLCDHTAARKVGDVILGHTSIHELYADVLAAAMGSPSPWSLPAPVGAASAAGLMLLRHSAPRAGATPEGAASEAAAARRGDADAALLLSRWLARLGSGGRANGLAAAPYVLALLEKGTLGLGCARGGGPTALPANEVVKCAATCPHDDFPPPVLACPGGLPRGASAASAFAVTRVLELGPPTVAAAALAWLDAAGGPANDDVNDMPELVDLGDGVRFLCFLLTAFGCSLRWLRSKSNHRSLCP